MQSGISAKAGCMLLAVLLAAPGAVARGKDKKRTRNRSAPGMSARA